MGSYLFKWDHPASEVFVTGTFDDWSKSEKLEKVGDGFAKTVNLKEIDKKIDYKFVVDGTWTTDHTAPQETDDAGNTNNFLLPENIQKHSAATDAGSSELPGAFPETPALENQTFGVAPIPASSGLGNPVSVAAGEPLPPTTRSVNDAVTLDKASYDNAGSSAPPQLPDPLTPAKEREQKGGMFGLDSTPGAGTMIPESGLAMGVGAGAGLGAAELASATGPHINSVGANSTTAQLAGQVPLEPRGGPHISSVGPNATTTGLAGQVPLESERVPEVVQESQEAAHVSPEASANPEAVQEKSAMEQELQSKIPEAPATSDNSVTSKAAGIAVGAAGAVTAAAAGTAAYLSSGKAAQDAKSALPVAAQQKIDDLTSNGSASNGTAIASSVPDTVQESISKAHQSPEAAANPEAVQEKSAVESELLSKTHSESTGNAIAATVPDTVQESIVESHQSPEAAANVEAVAEKSATENELLKKVHQENNAGEPAPTASAATSATAPAATDSSSHTGTAVAGGLAGSAATGAALAAITSGKTSSTPATTAPVSSSTATTSGLAAPASSQAQSSAPAVKPADSLSAPDSTPARDTARRAVDSRDVSPMTRGPTDSSAPVVTSGVGSATTAATSTPKKSAPAAIATGTAAATPSSAAASPASATAGESPASADKKKNRRSGFFGKLKEKLSSHKEKNSS